MTVRELLNQVFARVMPSDDMRQSRNGDLCSMSPVRVSLTIRGASGRAGYSSPCAARKRTAQNWRPQAIAAGAAAVVSERAAAPGSPVPWIVVEDARLTLAWLAAEFFQHPSRQMRVVGITGTNGKTTTSYIVSAIFEAAGSGAA